MNLTVTWLNQKSLRQRTGHVKTVCTIITRNISSLSYSIVLLLLIDKGYFINCWSFKFLSFFLFRPYGSVSYPRDRGRIITCLDGKTAHLESPAVNIRTISFSITCWVKIMDMGLKNHIYSDWRGFPYQFRLYVFRGYLKAELHGKGYGNTLIAVSG
jgi:hypothetical protein